MSQRVLVIAPHPDDEVLGPGGSIAKLSSAGAAVTVVMMTKGRPPAFTVEAAERVRLETAAAHQALGVREAIFLDFPAAGLDTVAHREVNQALASVFATAVADTLFVPFTGDVHLDHQRTFLSAMVCSRPGQPGAPSTIYAYETLSETNWNAPYVTPGFLPNVFVDISDQLETKVDAMRCYQSQLREFPDERSVEAMRALAMLRGATVGRQAAEALVLVRCVL